ncbi:MAG: prenyltransferase/squalene oxidase repeat-containing protein [Planctomycetota bacterium]|jgi:squalene-hopene/tetraprenyl-beta-curcumene cyclase
MRLALLILPALLLAACEKAEKLEPNAPTEACGDGCTPAEQPAPEPAPKPAPQPEPTPEPAESGESGESDPEWRKKAEQALYMGAVWLRAQAPSGVWQVTFGDKRFPDPAYTAMAATAVAQSMPREKRREDPLLQAAAAFVLKALREDGAVSTGGRSKYENYYTSAGLLALVEIGDPAHKPTVDKMMKFLLTLQRVDEARTKGGFGYNTAQGADLSNAQYAIEALRAAGLAADSPEMKAALEFLERAQNRSENAANQNAQYEMDDPKLGKIKVVPGDDGSAGYEPGVSKAGMRKLPDGTFAPRGYGSMTYALLKCYLLAGVKTDDDRVKAAAKWLGENYTWETNPGFESIAKEDNKPEATSWGLYYYYMTAAKALSLMGIDKLATPNGERDWREDLVTAILSRQKENGSWVNDKAARWQEGDPLLCTSYAMIALAEALEK